MSDVPQFHTGGPISRPQGVPKLAFGCEYILTAEQVEKIKRRKP